MCCENGLPTRGITLKGPHSLNDSHVIVMCTVLNSLASLLQLSVPRSPVSNASSGLLHLLLISVSLLLPEILQTYSMSVVCVVDDEEYEALDALLCSAEKHLGELWHSFAVHRPATVRAEHAVVAKTLTRILLRRKNSHPTRDAFGRLQTPGSCQSRDLEASGAACSWPGQEFVPKCSTHCCQRGTNSTADALPVSTSAHVPATWHSPARPCRRCNSGRSSRRSYTGRQLQAAAAPAAAVGWRWSGLCRTSPAQ